MNEHQQQIIDLYHNPINLGFLKGHTHKHKLANLSCGDEITMYLKVKNNVIEDISFEGEGCSISIASASLLTQELKGKDLKFIEDMTHDDVIELIGIPLTTSRLKCAVLGLEAVKKSITS